MVVFAAALVVFVAFAAFVAALDAHAENHAKTFALAHVAQANKYALTVWNTQ